MLDVEVAKCDVTVVDVVAVGVADIAEGAKNSVAAGFWAACSGDS